MDKLLTLTVIEDSMTILVLAGYPCSGKSSAADILGDAGYPVVSMGEEVRREAESRDEDEVWAVAEELRERHGKKGVAIICEEPLRRSLDTADIAVLEGSRHPDEIEYLEDVLGVESVIVWIYADFEDRVRWFSGREGRGKSGEDPEERLRLRTQREIDAGMEQLFAIADVLLKNDRDLAQLSYKITDVTWKIEKGDS